MKQGETITFDEMTDVLTIRAIEMTDVAVEYEDGIEEYGTCWFWFASIPEDDCWFAFAISDTEDNPGEMLDNSDFEELTRMSIFVGLPWQRVVDECPHCTAKRQRAIYNSLSAVIKNDIRSSSIEELKRFKATGTLLAWNDAAEAMGHPPLSMN